MLIGYEREKLVNVSASILDVNDEIDDRLKFSDVVASSLESH